MMKKILFTKPKHFKQFSSTFNKFNDNKMFCFQCEQTQNNTGCTTVGVCGKSPEVAGLQDILNFQSRRLAWLNNELIKNGYSHEKLYQMNKTLPYSPYETLTNVNFDDRRFHTLIKYMSEQLVNTQNLYEKITKKKVQWHLQDNLDFRNIKDWTNIGQKYVSESIIGVENRKKLFGEDVLGLEELLQYGLKGFAAYSVEGNNLGQFDPEVYKFQQEALGSLADVKDSKKEPSKILQMGLKVGEWNLRVMELLDKGGNESFGTPSPHQALVTHVKGKCICVSGHNIGDLEKVLIATEGKGINVYTHGELLPAHGYPNIRKHKHLIGNYGSAWQNQKIEFAAFPGAILVTSNCVQEPPKKSAHKIFTIGPVGVASGNHIENDDFSKLIEVALNEKGFQDTEKPKYVTVGFGHKTVLSLADTIVNSVKKGDIKKFYLIGGCDGAETERNYFRNLALGLPKDNIVMTIGCAKYRFNKEDFGTIKTPKNEKSNEIVEIPRLLDLGQCNDAYSAIKIASALASAFKTDINSLPLSYGISWFEQKAVVVFLTMIHLGIKNIQLGPKLPAFIPPSTLKLLVENYGVHPI